VDDSYKALEIFLEQVPGARLVKIDYEKAIEPGEWGWRMVAYDIQMPNRQLVEWYIPLRELEEAKGTNHLLFEKWRDEDYAKVMADPKRAAEYEADVTESYDSYQAAYLAGLERTGVTEAEARASLINMRASAESLTGTKSSATSPTVKGPAEGLDNQAAPSLTAKNPGSDTTTVDPSRDINTLDTVKTSSDIIPKTGEKSMDAPGSYRMEHEAPEPEPGASLDDVSNIYPDDIYSPDAARLYGSNGDDISRESAEIIKQARGNPDSIVTVYRAIPEGMDEINPGDWVSISKKYAEDHGVRSVGEPGGGGHVVVSREVRAGDIYTEGNSLHEWSWAPPVREAGEVVDTASKTVLPSKKLTVRVNRRAVDVLQNPTMGQRQQFTASIRAEMKADGVVNPDLLPLTRSTQDELGNTWLWDSSATMHTWMEAEEKLGHKNLSQNGANNAALKVQEAERLAEKTQGVVGAARLAEAAKDTGNEALDPANNVDLFDAARARMDMEDMEVSAGYRNDGTEILKSARQYAKELDDELEGLKALEACIKG
jgi:hypothetical protein